MVSATLSQEPRIEVLPCPVSCLSDDTVLSFVLPYRMNGPEGGKKKPKTPNAGLVAPTNNRRRTGDLVGTEGIEPNCQPPYILWQRIYSPP
jgi:hypothetical protein